MQELYQNSQLQHKEVKELISERNSHIQLIWERLNTLISVIIHFHATTFVQTGRGR
jgi:hypothetical protein